MPLGTRYHDRVPRRIQPIRHPVRIEHDGSAVFAERGEPLAAALIAGERLLLGRSPKLHRPRGPYCLRGSCEGCLARVDGVPNVMTCLVPAHGGERIITQNVLGSRRTDLLRATDFLFPHGIDHHRLFAGVAGLSSVVQAFARRAAGLGKLPDRELLRGRASRTRVRCLVAGAGAAGLSAAIELGGGAWLVDDAFEPGGSLLALEPAHALALLDRARQRGVRLSLRSTVLGLYRAEVGEPGLRALVLTPTGVHQVSAERIVVASGTHAGSAPFGNNDLPGVWSARAALMLLRHGILVGDRILIAGTGRFADEFEQRACALPDAARPRQPILRTAVESLVRATGRSHVTGAVLNTGGRERKIACDAVLVEGHYSRSLELVGQAGGRLEFEPDTGFRPLLDAHAQAAPDVYCAGSAAGSGMDSATHGARVGAYLAGG
ncbi:MAG TPA: (2Fe-2S)-binding protein [Polyangiaceae bacterium]